MSQENDGSSDILILKYSMSESYFTEAKSFARFVEATVCKMFKN